MVDLTHYKIDSTFFVHIEDRDRILSVTVSEDETELTSPVRIEDSVPSKATEIDQLDVPDVAKDKFALTVIYGSPEDSLRYERFYE